MWLPYRGDPAANFRWLKGVCGARTRPVYNRETKEFEVAREHTQFVIDALIAEYRRVRVVQYGHARTTCVDACWNASALTVADCVCGCAGANHGSRRPLGKEVRAGLSVENELVRADYVVTKKRWKLLV